MDTDFSKRLANDLMLIYQFKAGESLLHKRHPLPTKPATKSSSPSATSLPLAFGPLFLGPHFLTSGCTSSKTEEKDPAPPVGMIRILFPQETSSLNGKTVYAKSYQDITASEFISSDRFRHFGSPEERKGRVKDGITDPELRKIEVSEFWLGEIRIIDNNFDGIFNEGDEIRSTDMKGHGERLHVDSEEVKSLKKWGIHSLSSLNLDDLKNFSDSAFFFELQIDHGYFERAIGSPLRKDLESALQSLEKKALKAGFSFTPDKNLREKIEKTFHRMSVSHFLQMAEMELTKARTEAKSDAPDLEKIERHFDKVRKFAKRANDFEKVIHHENEINPLFDHEKQYDEKMGKIDLKKAEVAVAKNKGYDAILLYDRACRDLTEWKFKDAAVNLGGATGNFLSGLARYFNPF